MKTGFPLYYSRNSKANEYSIFYIEYVFRHSFVYTKLHSKAFQNSNTQYKRYPKSIHSILKFSTLKPPKENGKENDALLSSKSELLFGHRSNRLQSLSLLIMSDDNAFRNVPINGAYGSFQKTCFIVVEGPTPENNGQFPVKIVVYQRQNCLYVPYPTGEISYTALFL